MISIKSLVLLFLHLVVCSEISLNDAQTAASSSKCMNGGQCAPPSGSDCRCICVSGFAGAHCEVVLTQLNGYATYEYTEPISQNNISYDQLKIMIGLSINSDSLMVFQPPQQNQTHLSIYFSFYNQQPLSAGNYTAVESIRRSIQTQLSLPSSLAAVFGNTNSVSFSDISNFDVDECHSNWSECDPQATCVNANPGFSCNCGIGYQGNGKECSAVVCKASNAPPAPNLAERKFGNENGTLNPNPDDILPYGTSVQYICEKRYELVDESGNPIGFENSVCLESGWSVPQRNKCAMSLEFRIAIGISIVSSLIILIVIGGLIAGHFIAVEKKEKERERQTTTRDGLSLAVLDLEEIS